MIGRAVRAMPPGERPQLADQNGTMREPDTVRPDRSAVQRETAA